MNNRQASHQDDIYHIHSVNNKFQLGGIGTIWLPSPKKDAIFDATSTTLHIFQMKGPYRGLTLEDPHNHVWNFIVVCAVRSHSRMSARINPDQFISTISDRGS